MTERLTNLATSILAAPITSAGAGTLTVTSPGRFPNVGDFRIRVDSELMLVTSVSGSTFTVTRGIEGTTAATHLATADVKHVVSVASLGLRITETMEAQRGAANGYASLQSDGKIPTAQLPSGTQTYKGSWDASTNLPVLSDATGQAGWEYRVSNGASRNLGSGSKVWVTGGAAIHNGSVWEPIGVGGGAVTSVATRTGDVVLTKTDVSLANVDNTADTAKPVSTSQQTALNLKADAADLEIIGPRLTVSGGVGSGYTLTNADSGTVFDLGTNADAFLLLPNTGTFRTNWVIECCRNAAADFELRCVSGSLIETTLSVARVSSVWVKPQWGNVRVKYRQTGSAFYNVSGDVSLTP